MKKKVYNSAEWLRHCATSRKVAGSIPDGVILIFHWHNPPGPTMVLGSTQPLTEILYEKSTGWYPLTVYYCDKAAEKFRTLPKTLSWVCHTEIMAVKWLFDTELLIMKLTLSWPAWNIRPTYKQTFQARWDTSFPLLLHVAIYLEVSWSRETSM
jgi:hypothetical protein